MPYTVGTYRIRPVAYARFVETHGCASPHGCASLQVVNPTIGGNPVPRVVNPIRWWLSRGTGGDPTVGGNFAARVVNTNVDADFAVRVVKQIIGVNCTSPDLKPFAVSVHRSLTQNTAE